MILLTRIVPISQPSADQPPPSSFFYSAPSSSIRWRVARVLFFGTATSNLIITNSPTWDEYFNGDLSGFFGILGSLNLFQDPSRFKPFYLKPDFTM